MELCGNPSHPAKETTQSPGWEKNEEYWEGDADKIQYCNTFLLYSFNIRSKFMIRLQGSLHFTSVSTWHFTFFSQSYMPQSYSSLQYFGVDITIILLDAGIKETHSTEFVLQLQVRRQKHNDIMTYNQAAIVQVPKPPPYTSQINLKRRQQQQRRTQQAQVWSRSD